MTTDQGTHPMLAGSVPPPPPHDAYAYQRARQRRDAIDKLDGAALGVNILGWFVAVGGLIGGAGLCAYHPTSIFEDNSAHPYIGVGIATAVAPIIVGCVVVLLANWAEAWSEMQR